MTSPTQHLQLEVPCPACPESYSVSIDVVQESQRLLDEQGLCSGMASYECPAPYFASLASPEAIARLRGAVSASESDARHGVKQDGVKSGEVATPKTARDPRVAIAVVTLARELGRWENEGGAPEPRARDGSAR